MDEKIIRRALLGCREIEDVLCFERREYQRKKYDFLVECQIIIADDCLPITIGINADWPINLFDFYLRYELDLVGSEYRFIPHVEKNGKICLWRKDNILIDTQFEGLLQECVRKTVQILEEGKNGDNRLDFLREFLAYWCEIPNLISARVVLPCTSTSEVLKWVPEKTVGVMSQLCASPSSDELCDWVSCSCPLRNAAFFYVDATDSAVFPPNPVHSDLAGFLARLLDRVEYRTKIRIFRKLKPPYILFFHISQPYGLWADIGFRLNVEGNDIRDILIKCSQKQDNVEPIFVTRLDRKYLMQRITQQIRPLEELKFLLIGAGSIGAYYADFLGKAGAKNVTVVDNDILHEENIFRHLLGKNYVGKTKAEAICKYMKSSLPEVNYKSVVKTIEDACSKKDLLLKDYDIIIAATGNENVNRWLERKLVESAATCKVIYMWNEPLDIGCHAACVDMKLNGRYEDLFQYDENDMLINISAFAAPNQEFERHHAGCDGSFIPYGSEVSIQAGLLGMDLLKKSVSGLLKENVISSYKGEGFYFKKADFKVSKCYEFQNEKVYTTQLGKHGR